MKSLDDHMNWNRHAETIAGQSIGTSTSTKMCIRDRNQINWNWLYSFTNADGSSKFYDLNQVADVIDLSQFSEKALAQCTIDGQLLAIPVSMTGRIFYWNKTTFEKAGLETPTTLADLMAAGPVFAEKLGDDYYPLALGAYDKMILMVYYVESVYGKDWVCLLYTSRCV